jgi:alkanesulfonate monooxygenase SsuD/methylene tetrahydromethanopterin reductase-like flavin-dependent oxidoreductase (luciferase family)
LPCSTWYRAARARRSLRGAQRDRPGPASRALRLRAVLVRGAPTPEVSAAHQWSDEDRELVKDRVDTQLVGSPSTVADKLEQLQEATGADELAITTITHRHADRVRSYELLAREWHRRHG